MIKLTQFFALFLFFFAVISCGNDDDICTTGEATPRMKIKFKTKADGKLKTMALLYVDVDYGSGPVNIISNKVNVDSILVPLRVDNNLYTNIYIRTSETGNKSVIKTNYTTKSEYVSPACGVKKLYENVNSELITPNPVLGVEQSQNQIINENKTHLYLLF